MALSNGTPRSNARGIETANRTATTATTARSVRPPAASRVSEIGQSCSPMLSRPAVTNVTVAENTTPIVTGSLSHQSPLGHRSLRPLRPTQARVRDAFVVVG
jgi:hypothetical protein